MNSKNRKICLNMIVKNEAHIILETLNNIKRHIDYWVISDTGSTDGTQDIIKNFFKKEGIEGELVSHEWKDFGYNRSKAMEAAYNKSDYIWVIDADDIVVGDFRFPANMDLDIYNLKYGSDFTYDRGQIFKNRGLRWEYRGILHEFPACKNKKDVKHGKLEGNYYIDSRRLGARSKVSDKYHRDAKLLSEQIEKYPNDELTARYCFYAGQSYFDCQDFVNSIKYYQKRINFGGWFEEVYFSYNKIAQCHVRLKSEDNIIIEAYLKAHNYLPSRVEPLFELGEFYVKKDNFERALFYLEKASKKPFPTGQILFLHSDIYEWKAKYLYAMTLGSSKQYRLAYDYADKYHATYGREWQRFEQLKMSIVPAIENEYIHYDIKKVELITRYLSTNKKNNVTFTVTTCKRFDLFEKTMNSFINCCLDLLNIDRWLVVDDNSSEEDRTKMKNLYPFCEFVFKSPENKGHAVSMNIIRTMVKTPYILHMEDDWKFFVRKNYIKPAIEILIRNEINPIDNIPADQDIKNKKIGQVLFNKNYSVVPNMEVLGGYLAKTNNNIIYRIHEHYPAGSKEYNEAMKKYRGLTAIYWPHYSLQPSVMSTKIYNELGPYPEQGFFERLYADKYKKANYISVFYDTLSCIHIGKQTWDKSTDTKNAYDLNNVSQFNLNKTNLKKNDFVFDGYTFYANKDSSGHDICYVPNKTIEELKILADTNDNCVGFNTFGYLKFKICDKSNFINLMNKYHNNDGIYIKNEEDKIVVLDDNENNTVSENNITSSRIINQITVHEDEDTSSLNSEEVFTQTKQLDFQGDLLDNDTTVNSILKQQNIDDDFVFFKSLDIIGHDIHLKLNSIENMKDEALKDESCIGFNTYGYFKNGIDRLVKPNIFSSNDGIYIKKKYVDDVNNVSYGFESQMKSNLDVLKKLKDINNNIDILTDKTKIGMQKVVIVTTFLIKSIAENMKNLLLEMNYNVIIRFDLTEKDKDSSDIFIIIANQLNTKFLPKKYILYQVEQSTSKWFDDNYKNVIKNSTNVWDFSEKNIEAYNDLLKKTYYMPMPFYLNKNTANTLYNNNIKYDILFYGCRNERRNNIMELLSKKYNVKIGFDLIGDLRDISITQSKIVLNLHYYNNASLETCRLNEILKFNKLIISEIPFEDEKNKELYKNLVVFSDIIKDDLTNIDELYKLIDYYLDDKNYNNKLLDIVQNIGLLNDVSKKYVKRNMDIINNDILNSEFY